MFGRMGSVVLVCLSLVTSVGCIAADAPDAPAEEGQQESAVQIRTSKPGGCSIAICKKDGSGQYASMLIGTLVCDVHRTCTCERDSETAPCGLNSTDCRQSCTKTTPSKFEPSTPAPPRRPIAYGP